MAEIKDVFIKVAPQKYKIRIEREVWTSRDSTVVYIPYPVSRENQPIEYIAYSVGEVVELEESPGEKYLVCKFPDGVKNALFSFLNTMRLCGLQKQI